jgi:hypothetical protein
MDKNRGFENFLIFNFILPSIARHMICYIALLKKAKNLLKKRADLFWASQNDSGLKRGLDDIWRPAYVRMRGDNVYSTELGEIMFSNLHPFTYIIPKTFN